MSDLRRDVSNALNASAQAASHVATAYARMLSESEGEKTMLAGAMKQNEETLKHMHARQDASEREAVLWKDRYDERTKEIEEIRAISAQQQLTIQVQEDTLRMCAQQLGAFQKERELSKQLEMIVRNLLEREVIAVTARRILKRAIGEIDKYRYETFLTQEQKEAAEAKRG